MTKFRKPGSLKQALALLVESCGGQGPAAALLGQLQKRGNLSAQHVARMTDDQHPHDWMRVDQVALLESNCKDPIVAKYLAGQQNCIVEPVACAHHEPLPIVMGKITKETGELLSAAAMAVGAGKLTPTIAALVLRETDDVLCGLVQLRGECRAVLGSGAA